MATNILGSLIINLLTKADTTGLNKTDRAIQKTTKSVKTMNKEVGLIGKLSGKLMGGLNIDMVRNAFMGYLQFEKQLGSIHSRFYAITKDSQKANQQFEFARKIAKETATDINSVVDSYSIFYSSAQRALGESGAQEVYSNWTKVSRVLHLSGAQYERVMYALREMSSKGQLYAQDLMIQMGTHVPDIRNVAETAIKRLNLKGVTSIKDFQEYTKKNTGSDAMSRFLVEFSREARTRFASDEALKKALQQPDALVEQIKMVGFDLLYAFSKSGGSYMMVKILRGIADAIHKIPFEQITVFLGRVAHVVGDIFSILPQVVHILEIILLNIAILKGFKVIWSVFKGIKTFFNTMKILKGFGTFLPRVLYALSEAFPILKNLTGFFIRGGVKSALTGVLGVTGPLGWLVSSLLWLPEIVKVVKWIAKKMGLSKEGDIFAQHGTTAQQAYNILKKVSENKDLINDPIELQKQLGYYKGGEALAGNTYYDNGQIVLNFDGNILTLDDIKNMANEAGKQIEDKRKKSNTNWFNRPNLTEQEKNTKNIRGY